MTLQRRRIGLNDTTTHSLVDLAQQRDIDGAEDHFQVRTERRQEPWLDSSGRQDWLVNLQQDCHSKQENPDGKWTRKPLAFRESKNVSSVCKLCYDFGIQIILPRLLFISALDICQFCFYYFLNIFMLQAFT